MVDKAKRGVDRMSGLAIKTASVALFMAATLSEGPQLYLAQIHLNLRLILCLSVVSSTLGTK